MTGLVEHRGVRRAASAAVVCILAAAGALTGMTRDEGQQARSFVFHYQAVVTGIPQRANSVDVWLPVPKSDANQQVERIATNVPGHFSLKADPIEGNEILHFAGERPESGRLEFAVAFRVLRREAGPMIAPRPTGKQFLGPNRLVPVSGPILALARQVTEGLHSDLEQARAIYDYVVANMKYDKSGAGWGRGDAVRACYVRRGNCTDFHSLVIAMARAVGIPARFKIGFPVPADAESGQIPGYHCWAELYLRGRGWVPVDSSEASKHPERADYYFGRLDPNRVEFSSGRDIRLVPPQAGPPLNFFIYPYVEVDGKPHESVESRFTFAPASSQVALRTRQNGL